MIRYYDRLSFRRRVIFNAIITGVAVLSLGIYASIKNQHVPTELGVLFSFLFATTIYKFGCASFSLMVPPTTARRFGVGLITGIVSGALLGLVFGWGGGPPIGDPYVPKGMSYWLSFLMPVFAFEDVIAHLLILKPSAESDTWLSVRCASCRKCWQEYRVDENELSMKEQMRMRSYSDIERAYSCDYCGAIRCVRCNSRTNGRCPECGKTLVRTAWCIIE